MIDTEIVIAVLYLILGIVISLIIKEAEKRYTMDGVRKNYTQSGRCIYIIVFLIIEFFLLMQPIRYGMLPYEYVFLNSTSFNVDFFSLNGLYTNEMEPLFMFWCYIVRSITSSYTVFLTLSYGIVVYSTLRFISSFAEGGYKSYTFLLFWPVMLDFIFGIRYALGCGYCLLALVAMRENKWIKAIIFCLVATFTHFISLAFIVFIGYFFLIKTIFKRHIYALSTIIISLIGVYVFSSLALETFSTFRVSYRMTESASLDSYISYIPQILIAVVIWYYKRKDKPDNKKSMLILSVYYNVIMLQLTIQWGIYRLPYLFLLPMSVAVSNYFRPTKSNNTIYFIFVVIFYLYSLIKIVTMGVQNGSLSFD